VGEVLILLSGQGKTEEPCRGEKEIPAGLRTDTREGVG